jgi:hypothetical protein
LKKALKVTGKVIGGFLILLLVGWSILYIYFVKHKKELIQKAGTEIGNKIEARVDIKDAGISWFATFPYLSLVLHDVNIVDTSYSLHPRPFLEAKQFYVSCNLFQLVKGVVKIDRIKLSDGNIIFMRDASGKSNLHILDKQQPKKDSGPKKDEKLFNYLTLNNVKIFLSDATEFKKYDLTIKKLTCETTKKDSGTLFDLDINTHINYLGLYTKDGYYGNNKNLEGQFNLFLNSKAQTLSLDKIKLYLNSEVVYATGVFHMDTAQQFHLHLNSSSVSFENAKTTLLAVTQKTLAPIKTQKPIGIDIDMYGDTKYLSLPHVKMTWKVTDDNITIPNGIFTHASMTGSFMNEVIPGAKRVDSNSMVTFNDFTALWNGKSPIHSKIITVTNLIHPIVHCDMHINCNLSDVDSLLQNDNFTLEDGKANINLEYTGPVSDSGNVVPDIMGTVELSNAEVLYIPRNMEINKCNATIKFNHTEIALENVSGHLGKSSIVINGHINSFAPLFAHNNKEMILQWDIASPLINLTQLIPLITSKQKAKASSKKADKAALRGLSSALDSFTNTVSIAATFHVKRIVYNHFEADNVNADLTLNGNGWKINSLNLNQEGGKISVTGSLIQLNNDRHKALVNAKITNVDVSKIFYAFDNFGMQAFGSDNLKGQLSASAKLQLELDNAAAIVPRSLKGEASFSLVNGELIDFKPIEEISAKVFPKRNFKDIQFAELKDKFTVANYVVKMDKMEISSNLLHMYVNGVYGLKTSGTNLLIQIPASNLQKPEFDNAPANKGMKGSKEISVFVSAKNDDKGKINFTYSLTDKPPVVPKIKPNDKPKKKPKPLFK